MSGELVPLVMLPRYTVFAGKLGTVGTANVGYTTIAMDVTEFQKAILNVWRNAVMKVASGDSPSFAIYFEESTDQVAWMACSVAASSGSGPNWDPGDNTEVQYVATLTKRWFRVRVVLDSTGVGAAVTCWAVGFLEQRIR